MLARKKKSKSRPEPSCTKTIQAQAMAQADNSNSSAFPQYNTFFMLQFFCHNFLCTVQGNYPSGTPYAKLLSRLQLRARPRPVHTSILHHQIPQRQQIVTCGTRGYILSVRDISKQLILKISDLDPISQIFSRKIILKHAL